MLKNVTNENRIARNYGIDLLRFISMLMIVGLHVIGSGGILYNVQPLTFKGECVWFLEIACYCSVNCFALISGYVGSKSKHKWKNLISLCIQAIFYCVIFTGMYVGISLYNHHTIDLLFVLKSLIPEIFGRYWYFSAYFCLYFFMPILDLIIEMPKPVLKRAAVLILVVFCGVSQIFDKVSSLSAGYSVLWLAILYVTGGYFAKYNPWSKLSFWKNIFGYFSCVIVTLGSKILINLLIDSGKGSGVLVSYTSPTILLASIFLLNAFSNLKFPEKQGKTVLFFSSASFGVYLIHCQPFIYDKLLSNAFATIIDYNSILVILMTIAIVIAIYLICTAIDYLRKYIFKWLGIEWLIDRVSKIATKLFDSIEGTHNIQ